MEYSAIHDKLIISQEDLEEVTHIMLYAMKKYRKSSNISLGKRETESSILTDFDHAECSILQALNKLGIDIGVQWGNDLDLSKPTNK